MRLNRYLASAGLGSRRSCEEIILSGRVSVNGRAVDSLATQVSPGDEVRVGRRLIRPQAYVYLLLNKPPGYLCTRSDEKDRRTIFDLVPANLGRLFNVGRLDMDSEGLLILTNDGEFAQRLAHPSHQIEKEYDILIDRAFDSELIPKLLRGVHIEAGRARMASVRVLAPTSLKIVLNQGLKRQIRDMLWRVGYRVKKLARVRIGPLTDPRLKTGHWRPLEPREIAALKDAASSSGPLPHHHSHRAGRGRRRMAHRRLQAAPRDGSAEDAIHQDGGGALSSRQADHAVR